MKDYQVETVDCSAIINHLLEKKLDCSSDDEYLVVKRAVLGKIAIKRMDSYDIFCEYFKNVSVNCNEITRGKKCKRVLFVVVIDEVTNAILEQYQKILMFDKALNLEPVSYQVLFVDKNTKKGYFGGVSEKGKTLLYKDTFKVIKNVS